MKIIQQRKVKDYHNLLLLLLLVLASSDVLTCLSVCLTVSLSLTITRYRPGGGETVCPRRWQFDGGISFRRQSGHLRQSMDPKIPVDLRPSAVGSAVRTFLAAGGG